MKRLIFRIGLLSILSAFLAVGSVEAQYMEGYTANIPFDFAVGNKIFAPGDYQVGVKDQFTMAAVLRIRNENTDNWLDMRVLTNGSRTRDGQAVLRFDCFGDRYVLKQILATDFGLSAPKSKLYATDVKIGPEPTASIDIVLQ